VGGFLPPRLPERTPTITDDLDHAVAQLHSDDPQSQRTGLLTLYRIRGPHAEAAVTDFLTRTAPTKENPVYLSKTREIAARIAAELDPDRDPEPIIDVLRPFHEDMARGMGRLGFKRYQAPFTDPMFMLGLGVARLRRLSPTPHYANMLASGDLDHRCLASAALGDTADAEALPLLEGALHDPHHKVRTAAANGLRRLHNTGITWSGDPIDTTLRHGLADDHHRPARACAHTLITTGHGDDVRAALPNLSRSRQRRLSAALSGDIPRLHPLWAEDPTT
jgi:hypothetical protein